MMYIVEDNYTPDTPVEDWSSIQVCIRCGSILHVEYDDLFHLTRTTPFAGTILFTCPLCAVTQETQNVSLALEQAVYRKKALTGKWTLREPGGP